MKRTTLIRAFEVGCIIAALEHMHDRCECELEAATLKILKFTLGMP